MDKQYFTQYVGLLPKELRWGVLSALKLRQLNVEELNDAMNSRLCDLEETIDVQKLLSSYKKTLSLIQCNRFRNK